MIYAYLRVNTNDKSFEEQRLEILHYVKSKDMIIDKWVEEVASGLQKVKDRLLGQTLDNLSSGDILIVTELFRLGRDVAEVTNMLHKCKGNGVRIHTTKGKYEIGDTLFPIEP